MDDRSLRIAVLLSAHLIFLSAGALRILRGRRAHLLVAEAPWWIQYYPPLVWLPSSWRTYSHSRSTSRESAVRRARDRGVLGGFRGLGDVSLGRSYGIRLDVFEGHALKTNGPYAVVRHPMYLGIVLFHLGASLACKARSCSPPQRSTLRHSPPSASPRRASSA